MCEFHFIKKQPLLKGWSSDKKYCVTAADEKKYLLRVSPIEQQERKMAEFQLMKRVAALGVPMCQPIEFGTCKEGVYSLQSWIDGQDAEDIIPLLSDTEQYVYGLEAGRILKKIHSIPAPKEQEDWESRYNHKIDRKIKLYTDCLIKFDGADRMLAYINENRHLLKNRPQVFQHGDYHIGNMMIDQDGHLQIIDFDRDDYGDPWEEFNRIVWCAQKSPLFASGQINGYFDGDVPVVFWRLLALYLCVGTVASIPWAIPFGQGEIEIMLTLASQVLQWYDNMQNLMPSWYCKGFYLQYINGLPYKLKVPYDFGFLSRYGKIFKIFDDQDSGNICFGIEKDGQQYFIKFAGAPTEQYTGNPEDAIARLQATLPVYQALKHSNLIEFVRAEEIGGGFAMVFRWTDGVCMGRQYPASHQEFLQMSLESKQQVFRDILSFFVYVASQGYVAIDFYDGSILYDFETEKTTVCDIDFFQKMPYINCMGRLWGSSHFQAPEEYQMGAVIDEITNVYTLGATAFALFADFDRSRIAWPLGDRTFGVVEKAVSDNRQHRQQSIGQFIEEWESAI